MASLLSLDLTYKLEVRLKTNGCRSAKVRRGSRAVNTSCERRRTLIRRRSRFAAVAAYKLYVQVGVDLVRAAGL
jgi:hypothetical protein